MLVNSGAGARRSYERRMTAPISRFQSTSASIRWISPIASSSSMNSRWLRRCSGAYRISLRCLVRSSPQRGRSGTSIPNRSSARPAVWSTMSSTVSAAQVEGGHRRHHDRARLGGGGHGPQVAQRERRLADQEEQRPALLQRDVGGPGQQVVAAAVGDRDRVRMEHGRRSSVGAERARSRSPRRCRRAGRRRRPSPPGRGRLSPVSCARVCWPAGVTTRCVSTPALRASSRRGSRRRCRSRR